MAPSFLSCFPNLSTLTFSKLKTLTNIKALGGDIKALTILLPQMRSTTQTGAVWNTRDPNLPQFLIVHIVSSDPNRWLPGIQDPAAEILKRRITRERPSTAGLLTVLKLHGKKFQFEVFWCRGSYVNPYISVALEHTHTNQVGSCHAHARFTLPCNSPANQFSHCSSLTSPPHHLVTLSICMLLKSHVVSGDSA